MHMIQKRQMVMQEGAEGLTAAEQFYSLARTPSTDQGNCPFMTS